MPAHKKRARQRLKKSCIYVSIIPIVWCGLEEFLFRLMHSGQIRNYQVEMLFACDVLSFHSRRQAQ